MGVSFCCCTCGCVRVYVILYACNYIYIYTYTYYKHACVCVCVCVCQVCLCGCARWGMLSFCGCCTEAFAESLARLPGLRLWSTTTATTKTLVPARPNQSQVLLLKQTSGPSSRYAARIRHVSASACMYVADADAQKQARLKLVETLNWHRGQLCSFCKIFPPTLLTMAACCESTEAVLNIK